jgi:predicted ATPase
VIRTPDQRLRVFVSSTLGELAPERVAVRAAIETLRLTPVMFEGGARPHSPRDLYRAYLDQSDVFIGIYWEEYGFVAPGELTSGLEDEYVRAAPLPKLIYVKHPASARVPRLATLLSLVRNDDLTSYKAFTSSDELRRLVENDVAVLLTERFAAATVTTTASSKHHLLPIAVTPLVGRDDLVTQLIELLVVERCRLVTLTGPGGVGKSRLAFEVGARLMASIADGVALVELAPVLRAEEVAGTIAVALGVRRTSERSAIEDIIIHLAGSTLLLVVDNFEQVADAAPVLSELLAAVGGLSILVTSRSALRLSGERTVEVPPLSIPVAAAEPDLAELAKSAAVALFVHRALSVDSGFVLDASNASAVASIARELDGLPLAIELAASRIRLLPPAALSARLHSRLDLLTAGARDLPERQRTLRSTIAWSHELLDAEARRLFALLGPFVGGFDLAAVEGVSGSDDDIACLEALVNASLVRSQVRDGEPRFSLLATIREYSLERLGDGEACTVAHDRHADQYLLLAEAADNQLHGPNQLLSLTRLERDVDNLRAAASWYLDHDQTEKAIRLVRSTWLFWWLHGHLDEAVSLTQRMVANSAPLAVAWRGWAQTLAGSMAFATGDFRSAERLLEEGVETFRSSGDGDAAELPMILLGQTLSLRGDFDRATRLLDDGLVASRRHGNDWESAKQLNFRGQIPLSQGDPATAGGFFEQALQESRLVGDRLLILTSLSNLALSRQALGRTAEAEVLIEEGITLAHEAGDAASASHFLDRLAVLVGRREDGTGAEHLDDASHTLRESSGTRWLRAFAAAPIT